MYARLKTYIKNSVLYAVARPIYKAFEWAYDFLRLIIFSVFPALGRRSYNAMQRRQYVKYTGTFNDSMQLCVGEFDAHEAYPYEDYLLEEYVGHRGIALDFACGMGRMMKRFLPLFDVVDGVDLSAENIGYAKEYLLGKGYSNDRFNLFQTSGLGVDVDQVDRYDFIYSTIALQHISVYEIRRNIFEDLFEMLKPGGSCCYQMGFGWDNGIHWFDNNYTARSTNAGADVCVPDESHLGAIKVDFENIGYRNIKFTLKLSPHPEKGNNYHPIWLFIHMTK